MVQELSITSPDISNLVTEDDTPCIEDDTPCITAMEKRMADS
ncbi:MAG: hypothetical protein AAF921_17485 [Cyanobacteria bacterium P01_D01_bin.44]